MKCHFEVGNIHLVRPLKWNFEAKHNVLKYKLMFPIMNPWFGNVVNHHFWAYVYYQRICMGINRLYLYLNLETLFFSWKRIHILLIMGWFPSQKLNFEARSDFSIVKVSKSISIFHLWSWLTFFVSNLCFQVNFHLEMQWIINFERICIIRESVWKSNDWASTKSEVKLLKKIYFKWYQKT